MTSGARPLTVSLEDAELDDLFALPLAEFVEKRNALARRLKQAGDGEASSHVKKLGKPSVSAWVINQIARQRRELLDELLAAIDRVGAAQIGALYGREDAPELPETMREERQVATRVETAVADLLDEAGYVASKATIERTLRSLRAAAADPKHRDALTAGRMVEDIDPPGFDGLAAQVGDMPPPPPPPRRRPQDTVDLEIAAQKKEAILKREEQEERRRLEEARRDSDERRRELRKKMDAARRSLETAQQAETRLEREQNAATRDRQEAERRLRELERLTEQIETHLGEARAQRETAETELDQLKAALSELP